METLDAVAIGVATGVDGDHKGLKYPNRAVTVLSVEDWRAAIADLADLAGPVPLPWTVRRANLLVEAVRLPRARGGQLRIGPVLLEITGETFPCQRMDEAHPGLLRALAPAWRGGVTCRVVEPGTARVGDAVEVAFAPVERVRRLP